ncbi:MAG: methylated-DNA--[protein]-cysteine S-methyltransferase [Desulfovibrio sp.]|nr:methylated-DNA--[protein]-cysteine S-methyltransferase [Desulfovibrio sp.]
MNLSYRNYASPFGNLVISFKEENCVRIEFASLQGAKTLEDGNKLKNWLDEYFSGNRPDPAIAPIALRGTDFQNKVWEAMLRIPYGETTTYSDISLELTGKTHSARAVGQGVGANPLAILIPCHRVLARNGPGGYAWGVEIKKKLLEHERNSIGSQRTTG